MKRRGRRIEPLCESLRRYRHDARTSQRPDRRPLGDHLHRAREAPLRLRPDRSRRARPASAPSARATSRRPRRRSSPSASPARCPNTPGWQVRVVSNKFPALQIEGDLDRRAEGIYDKMNGIGAHEVIIETTEPRDRVLASCRVDHDRSWSLRALRERMLDLAKDRRFRYIQVFKNHGEAAGRLARAQPHPAHRHPDRAAARGGGARRAARITSSSRSAASSATSSTRRLIAREAGRLPERGLRRPSSRSRRASRSRPGSCPRRHEATFEACPTTTIAASFAGVLKESLQRINLALNKPPYNFVAPHLPLQRLEGRRATTTGTSRSCPS